MALRHTWLKLVAIVGTVILQIITMALIFWSMDEYDISAHWYNKKGPSRSYFDIQYGPPKWLLDSVWPVLLLYQLAWQAYTLSTLFRTTPDNKYFLYQKPNYIPWPMYLAWVAGLILRITWAAILPRCGPMCTGLVGGSFVLSTAATVIAWIGLYRHGYKLYDMCLSMEIYLVRGLLHNGLAAYATWELFEFLVSFSGVFHVWGLSARDASTTALGLGGLALIVYGILDLMVYDRHMRYTVSPYFVTFYFMIGMLTAHSDAGSVTYLSGIIMAFSLIILLGKVLNIFARRKGEREPLKCHKKGKKRKSLMVLNQPPVAFQMPISRPPTPPLMPVITHTPDYGLPGSTTMPGPVAGPYQILGTASMPVRMAPRVPSISGLDNLPMFDMLPPDNFQPAYM